MKRLILVLVLLITTAALVSSCTAVKSSRSGCKTTQNMVGYR
ncbi:MAG: hypothetical protein SFU87_09345 [Chitinophagaceae bacterium]|nr:hypothetical protein [Chitinophagaceae bacterium]